MILLDFASESSSIYTIKLIGKIIWIINTKHNFKINRWLTLLFTNYYLLGLLHRESAGFNESQSRQFVVHLLDMMNTEGCKPETGLIWYSSSCKILQTKKLMFTCRIELVLVFLDPPFQICVNISLQLKL